MIDFLAHQIVSNLDSEEKATLFALLTDHVDLVEKLIPGAPFVRYIKYNEPFEHAVAVEYTAWKSKR
jgi:hypothetical protein